MSHKEYKAECVKRWHGIALRDALSNYEQWEEMQEYLTEAMRQYLRNPFQQNFLEAAQTGEKCFNPSGSLNDFLWNCQAALQPSRSRLDPLLDFEEHYQKIFLRRGLIIYCKGILNEIQSGERNTQPEQETLFT